MRITTSLTTFDDRGLISYLQSEADKIASIGMAVRRPDNREKYQSPRRIEVEYIEYSDDSDDPVEAVMAINIYFIFNKVRIRQLLDIASAYFCALSKYNPSVLIHGKLSRSSRNTPFIESEDPCLIVRIRSYLAPVSDLISGQAQHIEFVPYTNYASINLKSDPPLYVYSSFLPKSNALEASMAQQAYRYTNLTVDISLGSKMYELASKSQQPHHIAIIE